MTPLLAEIWIDAAEVDKRGTARRTLRLRAEASSSRDAITVLIHNLSRSGLMIESIADLAAGDVLEVELPRVGSTPARVVWARDGFFGCEFLMPVSKAVVSAALLRTPAVLPDPVKDQRVTEPGADFPILPPKPSKAVDIAATIGLTLLLFAVVLFVAALVFLPFSAEQGLSLP